MAEFNKNMLSPVGFNFNILRAPDLNFFVQSITLPGISMPNYSQPNPFISIPRPGDHIEYGELSISFKINEDLSNYIGIFNWITGLGFPDEFEQYNELAKKPSYSGEGLYSDGNIMILSSSMNPIIRIDIKDMFPVSLSDIPLDTRDTSIQHIDATASFKFRDYTFTRV
jgi:hypothetical protein